MASASAGNENDRWVVAHITCGPWPDDPPEVKVSDPSGLVVNVENQIGEDGVMLVDDQVVETMQEALRLVEQFHPDEIHLRGPTRHYQLVDETGMSDVITVPQPLRLTVDAHGWEGTQWEVRYDRDQPGTYHYNWANCPQPEYGFSTSRVVANAGPGDRERLLVDDATVADHEEAIREFLAQVGPVGVIEDDYDDGSRQP